MNAYFILVPILAAYVCETHAHCMTHLNGGKCEQVQIAGRKLSEDINQMNDIMTEVIMRSTEESYLIMQTSVNYLKKNLPTTKIQLKQKASIEDATKLKAIQNLMSKQLQTSLNNGHIQMLTLIKDAAQLVVDDEIVSNELIKFKTNQRMRRNSVHPTPSMNSLDGKISSLYKPMLDSLLKVEEGMKGSAKELFQMFADSLKLLYQDQQTKQKIEDQKVALENYLRSNLNVIIKSQLQRFVIVLKEVARQIEIIDSVVKSQKNNPNQLKETIEPARIYVDESIRNIQDPKHVERLKKELEKKVNYVKEAYISVKNSMTG